MLKPAPHYRSYILKLYLCLFTSRCLLARKKSLSSGSMYHFTARPRHKQTHSLIVKHERRSNQSTSWKTPVRRVEWLDLWHKCTYLWCGALWEWWFVCVHTDLSCSSVSTDGWQVLIIGCWSILIPFLFIVLIRIIFLSYFCWFVSCWTQKPACFTGSAFKQRACCVFYLFRCTFT